ncbi:hypothetical protein MLD38_009038 [Melastoma candidum]|uniref:Uncharacterized protein n=2 Tax=Melastoma candidum TaxID=119954 RepID=A0ACB9RZB5_9MYRT|nr:hypothetical protein MLD38_009038 [Melastoma candidum]
MAPKGGAGAVEGNESRRRKLMARGKIQKRGDPKHQQLGAGDSSSPADTSNDPIVTRAKATEEGDEDRAASDDELPMHGEISVIGMRREMEDAVRVAVGFVTLRDGRGYDFYGVYDGHGGSRVADFCRERLHLLLAEELERENGGGGGRDGEFPWEKVMAECFKKTDSEVGLLGNELASMGPQLLWPWLVPRWSLSANCGDSRAVISRNGVPVALSEDHKPNRPDELARIQAAGGRVIEWDGYRVLGVLATSRSIGDRYLKPYVIPDPEMRVSPRTDADEFLILGSDGLWDVMTNEYACRVVRKCLKGKMKSKWAEVPVENRSAEAAAVLTEMAMALGSQDNITVVVVELNSKKFGR